MKKILYLLISVLALTSCGDSVSTVNLGLDDTYYISRMSKLILRPAFTGDACSWYVDGAKVSDDREFIFMAKDEGVYHLDFEIDDSDNPLSFAFTVNVMHEEIEYSPYISRVYEYRPAPGQFVNTMPVYDEGDTEADMVRKCEESIGGTNNVVISLGAYGGYITFGFDHTVMNVQGQNDFRIWGNAFYETTDKTKKGGSSEPGIVMVSLDTNCNGLPDDQWYELVGSEYARSRHNYTLTYHRPDPDRVIESDKTDNSTDKYYIQWNDSEGERGYIPKNSFHRQEYYPQWIAEDEMSFTGSCLPDNAIDTSGTGRYYILYCYDRGYADNHPNDNADLNSFDIGNAVDSKGNHIDLAGADFIRVYTGINQICGWLGETSTEISKAMDLHLTDNN